MRASKAGQVATYMKKLGWLIGIVALSLVGLESRGAVLGKRNELERVNACIQGQVLDFTHNHGSDRRIWSAALCEKRDLYVYLPPGFDPAKKYPLGIFLHGATQDEQFFMGGLVERFDKAIVQGKLPPFIVAVPDGSLRGRPSFFNIASFFANSDAGRYEDYLMEDVWNFVMENFPIRPEREAHALIGASMGGSAAFAQAIKHRDKIKVAIGFMPALNLRWVDCHDRYQSPFDPCCWGWRTKLRPCEVIGRPGELIKIRFRNLYGPLIGHGPDAMAKLSSFNPIELMDQYDLRDGELALFAAYGGQDEFNMGAQVESFLYRAKERGVTVAVTFDPQGKHDVASGRRLFPDAVRWIAPLMAPFANP
jgi:S-formylglutathione hydrolase FrmB